MHFRIGCKIPIGCVSRSLVDVIGDTVREVSVGALVGIPVVRKHFVGERVRLWNNVYGERFVGLFAMGGICVDTLTYAKQPNHIYLRVLKAYAHPSCENQCMRFKVNKVRVD